MRFFFAFLLIVMLGLHLPGRTALAHDCPLQHLGRLDTFRALDQDKDGRLSPTEFMAQGWCQQATPCQCQETARQFFQRLDKNRDGFVTLGEYQALKRDKQQPHR